VAVNYEVGDGPNSIFACDLDGDGDNDLAVVNSNSNNVSILTNNGDGDFLSAVNYGVGLYPFSVFAADIDCDNDSDLVTANYNSGTISILFNQTTGTYIENRSTELPTEFSLSQNYPNPFNAQTKIAYSLTKRGEVSIDIFDILGRKITQLAEGSQEPGIHEIIWGATDIPTGIYFYRLTAGDYQETKRMLLLK
jgi:hypothetical protein